MKTFTHTHNQTHAEETRGRKKERERERRTYGLNFQFRAIIPQGTREKGDFSVGIAFRRGEVIHIHSLCHHITIGPIIQNVLMG